MVREERKEMRRQRTLDAAEVLIRETGSTEFSMLTLAGKANLSPATPYNLFGSKSTVLYALLNRSLDEIVRGAAGAFTQTHPFQRVMKAAESAANFFVSNPDFYRPIYKFLMGVNDPVHQPAYRKRSLEYWMTALAAIEQEKLLPEEVECKHLAHQLMINFIGALNLWVHEELTNKEFHAQISYGTAMLLLGIAQGENRELILKRLNTTRSKLCRQFASQKIPQRQARTTLET